MADKYKCMREDGSILAVVSTHVDGVRFFKIDIVEDSDWLDGADMVRLTEEVAKIVRRCNVEVCRTEDEKTV